MDEIIKIPTTPVLWSQFALLSNVLKELTPASKFRNVIVSTFTELRKISDSLTLFLSPSQSDHLDLTATPQICSNKRLQTVMVPPPSTGLNFHVVHHRHSQN